MINYDNCRCVSHIFIPTVIGNVYFHWNCSNESTNSTKCFIMPKVWHNVGVKDGLKRPSGSKVMPKTVGHQKTCAQQLLLVHGWCNIGPLLSPHEEMFGIGRSHWLVWHMVAGLQWIWWLGWKELEKLSAGMFGLFCPICNGFYDMVHFRIVYK